MSLSDLIQTNSTNTNENENPEAANPEVFDNNKLLSDEDEQELLEPTTCVYSNEVKLMQKMSIQTVSHGDNKRMHLLVNYYIASNIRYRLLHYESTYDGYDSNLEFPFITQYATHFEFADNDKLLTNKFTYLIGDTGKCCYKFKFKGQLFMFSSRKLSDTSSNTSSDSMSGNMFDELMIYHTNIKLLEDLLTTAEKYFNKYYYKNDVENKTIKLYYNRGKSWFTGPNINKRDIRNLYLDKNIKNDILNKVKNFKTPNTIMRYERFGIVHKFVCLLYGVPGSGKTTLVKSIASELNLSISYLSFDINLNDEALMNLIKHLGKKTILLIEDMDCLFKSRKSNDEFKNTLTLSGILNILDGLMTSNDMIVFITTNMKDNLYDEALIRPGRIDHFIKFDYIQKNQLIDMYKVFMENAYDEEKMKKFVDAYFSLGINGTTALLQSYLFCYVDDPDNAFEHIDDIKKMKYESTYDKFNENPMGII